MTLSHCRKVPANETCPWDSPSHTQTTPPPSSSPTPPTTTTATTATTSTTAIGPAPAKDSIGGGAGGAGPSDSEATGSGSQANQPRGDGEYQRSPAVSCEPSFLITFLLKLSFSLIFTVHTSLHSSSLLDQHSLLGLRHRGPLQLGRPRPGGAPPRG